MATNLTKSDINSFLNEIQHKARVSINEKEDRLLSEESARLIQENDISSDIEKLAKLIHETQEVVCRLNKAIDKINGYPRKDRTLWQTQIYSCLHMPAEKPEKVESLKKEAYRKVAEAIKNDSMNRIRENTRDERNKTENAYHKVWRTLKTVRSIKQSLEYLSSLGFDVEKIKHIEKEEPNLQITASKDDLFPCLKGEKQEEKGV